MAVDLNQLLDPGTTAVVTCELQRGVIGDLAPAPELADEAASIGVIPHATALAHAARRAGARVVHAVVELRGDRAGLTINNPIMAMSVKNPDQIRAGTPAADLVPELGPEPEDIVCRRIHGLTPFTGTELDSILRNLGVKTIVPVGVSVNEALLGLCLSAADLGYQLALPTDAIAGLPRSYAEDVVRYSLAMLAKLTTTIEIIAIWEGRADR
jgi:nicotinamidase-related amidase